MANMIIELSEEIIESMSDKEVEILKLQKMMVGDLTRERDSLKNQLSTLIESSSKHELEVIELESQLDSLTARIADLLDEKNQLQEIHDDSIRLEAYNNLQAKHDEISLKLEVNKQTLKTVLTKSHELERKLTDAQFKLGTAIQERDGLLELNKTLKTDNAYLSTRFNDNESLLTAANKLNRDLQSDVDGFPVRLENACKAAVKQYQDTHIQVSQSSSKADQDRIKELESVLHQERVKNTALGKEVDDLKAELTTVSDDFKQCMDLVQLSHENVNAMEAQYKRMKEENDKHKSYGKQCCELVASMQSDHVREQRDNIYLGHILEYLGGKAIYADPDGTTVFIISSDLGAKVSVVGDGTPAETPHPKYPLFWIAHKNGLGHMAMISIDEQNLILPENLAKKYLVNTKHWDGILDAIRGNTLQEYQRALDEATVVAQNLSKQAEYFDYDFAQTFDRAAFIKAGFACGAWDKEKLKNMEDDFYMLNTLAKRYRIRHKTVNSILSRRKNMKKKGKK